jgi:hypothetical protein
MPMEKHRSNVRQRTQKGDRRRRSEKMARQPLSVSLIHAASRPGAAEMAIGPVGGTGEFSTSWMNVQRGASRLLSIPKGFPGAKGARIFVRRKPGHSADIRRTPPQETRASLQWWQRAVIYQVAVQSFQDSNGDGKSDLRGLIQRIDHLTWLGMWSSLANPDLSVSQARLRI